MSEMAVDRVPDQRAKLSDAPFAGVPTECPLSSKRKKEARAKPSPLESIFKSGDGGL